MQAAQRCREKLSYHCRLERTIQAARKIWAQPRWEASAVEIPTKNPTYTTAQANSGGKRGGGDWVGEKASNWSSLRGNMGF